MRVAFETSPIYISRAGTSRYVRSLWRAFQSNPVQSEQVEEFVWPVSTLEMGRWRKTACTVYRELLWPRIAAIPRLRRGNFDVFHSTGNILLEPPKNVAHVVTLLDLAVLRYPHRFRRWHRFSARRQLQHLHQASRIICISQFTADEAISLMGIPAKKLEVVHLGSDFHSSEAPPQEQRPAVTLPSEFFLFVGTLEPGKNLALLREAYLAADSRGIVLPPLLIAGARWQGVAREGPAPKGWLYLGHVTDAELVFLYRRARGLVFPSIYEGFGLPVLEAMALGCPVICSAVASLPEVGGDAVEMAALNAGAYLQAMQRLSTQDELSDSLRRQGRIQAERFSWARCADETWRVYEMVG